jgi:hypothetical protein
MTLLVVTTCVKAFFLSVNFDMVAPALENPAVLRREGVDFL